MESNTTESKKKKMFDKPVDKVIVMTLTKRRGNILPYEINSHNYNISISNNGAHLNIPSDERFF